MNKEEIEELKDFTIDLTDIDELALGLEVCSRKSNMVIQEFADTIIQLQQERNQFKEYANHNYDEGKKKQQRIDKAIDYINKTNFWGLYEDTPMIDVKYGEDLLKILKGDSNE